MPSTVLTMEIQGHRGSRGTLPENTLLGFAEAIRAGVDRLELDLLLTKDEEIVIYHDLAINQQLCEGPTDLPSFFIKTLTLTQIKEFDCGCKINPLFPRQISLPGTAIPTLEQLLEMLSITPDPKFQKVGLNLEIKVHPLHPELTAEPEVIVKKLLEIIKKWNFEERVYYSSFDPRMLLKVRELNPDAMIAFVYSSHSPPEEIEKCIKLAIAAQADIISPEHTLLTDTSLIDHFHEMGFKVITWTVNQTARLEELVKMGVDGIITDYPADFITHLKRL